MAGMKYLSVCSGIESATVAWKPLGWTAAGFSEIDKFPSAVLAHHYPDVPNFGDFTTIEAGDVGPIDLLVGGTPCQSFSVAGLRGGLDDDRGNLALEFFKLARRCRPRWLVWENVPGVLSSNGGRDFGSILGAMGELGYGFAYRVLDAQYVRVDGYPRAVPQRRRRVFVVGYLGDWRRAAAVLFEPESLRGDPPPRREAGERPAPTISARPTGGGGLGTDFDLDGGLLAFGGNHTAGPIDVVAVANVSPALKARDFKGPSSDGDGDGDGAPLVACALRGEGFDASEDGTGRGTPIVPVGYRTSPNCGAWETGDRVDALTTGTDPSAHLIAFSSKDHGGDAAVGRSPTLRAMGHAGSHPNAGGQVAVAFDLRGREGGAMPEGPHDTANIRAASGGASRSYVANPWAVRRLTPKETERLQGFADDYTRIPWRGKPAAACPDGPRYKAVGNAMAVNVMRWVGRRIDMVGRMV